MAKAGYEQPPVEELSKDPNYVYVKVQRSGDDIVDASTKALYESLGYEFREESKLGTVTMACHKDVDKARQQRAIDDHRAREKMTLLDRGDRTGLINVEERVTKANTPVSAESLASTGVNSPVVDDDFDEL